MKIARATPEDINALADLASAVEAMRDGNIPPEDGEDEWEYIGPLLTDLLRSDIPPSQQEEVINICRRCLLRLFEIADSGWLMRAATNLDTVFMPENQIINLEAGTLETHPSIDQGWADTARLDWLAAQDDISITLGNAINLKLPDLRAATDAAMQEQAAEAEAT
ncbi:hypothetical protein [Eikenella corrodens]|uniref:hypothetical protein n=1 Tax=Eikenella corrodens TaxID=539 RepID=UPI00129A619E|nr:hypothetical protein [Eikenella corrodens]